MAPAGSQKAADFVSVLPAAHNFRHTQGTLVPPENVAAGVRKVRTKKRAKQDRTIKQDDEPRFNTGLPRSIRSQTVRRAARAHPTNREAHNLVEQDPPPSFQEAISTPPTSPLPGSTAAPPPSISITIPTTMSGVSSNTPTSYSPTFKAPQSPRSSLAVNASTSSSESSLEIVDIEPLQTEWEEDRKLGFPLEERVKRECLRRRAADLASVAPNSGPTESQSMFEAHRFPRQGRGILDSDEDSPEAATYPCTPVSTKARIFSPLRVLTSPPRAPERNRAASPTFPSSPCSFNRSKTTFLRSTTSLGRFPLPSKSEKPDLRGTRKLFKGKGKEGPPVFSEVAPELLDTWEMLELDISCEENITELEPAKQASALHRAAKRLPPDTTVTPYPPLSVHSVSPSQKSSALSTTAKRFPTDVTVTPYPSPLVHSVPPSELSQKSPQGSPTAFVNRPIRRPVPPAPPTLSISTVPIEKHAFLETSSSTPMKRRPPPPPPSRPLTRSHNPPKSSAVEKLPRESAPVQTPSTPPSPSQSTIRSFNMDSLVQREPSTPTMPEPTGWRELARRLDTSDIQLSSRVQSLQIAPETSIAPSNVSSIPPVTVIHDIPVILSCGMSPTRPSPASPSSVEGTPRPGRHYAGRPLPQPPTVASQPPATPTYFPEGLLIDLDTECPDPRSMPSTPVTNRTTTQTPPDFIQNNTPRFPSSSPIEDLIEAPPPSALLSPYAHLNVLLSQLAEDRTGANYDALLSLTDMIGPGTRTPIVASHTSHSIRSRAQIVLDRRRVTKDGRVKLKLSLLGVAVERCGICLSQFKEGEWAGSGDCQHAFHESCLLRWLARKGTCPMCRIPLGDIQT